MAKGLPPLPSTTPHTLRRTYISIALLANNFDVKWVMGQVGHANSKMTLDVYAQLEQRADRSHGTSFDGLIRRAREELKGVAQSPDEASTNPEEVASWSSVGHDPKTRRPPPSLRVAAADGKRISKPIPKWRGPESNWRHHDFQSCALPTELPRREAQRLASAA
jgi:hypothetical protein